jgi:hypothetical protein
VPEDDALREAALRVVEDRLIVVRGTRVRARATATILLLVSVLLAVLQSPWWWIAVVLCVGLLVLGPWPPPDCGDGPRCSAAAGAEKAARPVPTR